MQGNEDRRARWRVILGDVVYNSDTRAGRIFDLVLSTAIVVSVLAVMFDSVAEFHTKYAALLDVLEWGLTLLFTAEYVVRIVTARHAWHYTRSFFGLVDLLSILPAYLALLLPGVQYLLIIRVLRLLRIFRVLKLVRYLSEASILTQALRASLAKITVFIAVVLVLVIVIGTLMYVVEGPKNGFTSIPASIYWAIVTLTTVGYGDIAPKTAVGKTLASIAMIMGYGIIAVPTGIVTVGLTHAQASQRQADASRTLAPPCSRCGLTEHHPEARYCRRCGERLSSDA